MVASANVFSEDRSGSCVIEEVSSPSRTPLEVATTLVSGVFVRGASVDGFGNDVVVGVSFDMLLVLSVVSVVEFRRAALEYSTCVLIVVSLLSVSLARFD